MQNVEMVFVYVYLITMEMVMYPADQNVFRILTVHVTKLASETNVKIHVFLELVVKAPYVTSLTMLLCVLVLLELQEVHLSNVNQFRTNLCTQTHVNLHLVDQTVNAVKSINKLYVHVCQITLVVHLTVDQNVLSTLIVLLTKLASIRNVWIHVLELVVRMPIAGSSITTLAAHVKLASLETREYFAVVYLHLHHKNLHRNMLTLVYHHLVDHIPNAETSMDHHHALVYQTISELHRTVDQNVFKTRSVHTIKPVLMRNVETHVLVLAVKVLNVESSIIVQSAIVPMDSLEMPLARVIQNRLNPFKLQNNKPTHAFVLQTQCVVTMFACVCLTITGMDTRFADPSVLETVTVRTTKRVYEINVKTRAFLEHAEKVLFVTSLTIQWFAVVLREQLEVHSSNVNQ
ncbi:uncharacterized protein LOC113469779 [Diaphorina citri]|uniref:Uncharacterized protein LOC113469779 n=1 Tax=Diaphorina citri TaxID=121845 RepID=A0A3Q0J4Z1_DIACI|nr:uncharacterized protein LOC113469779 [Diaphorina citri]